MRNRITYIPSTDWLMKLTTTHFIFRCNIIPKYMAPIDKRWKLSQRHLNRKGYSCGCYV